MEELTLKFKELKKRFRSRENGPAVESMNRMGLIYKKNHGVGISELKQIADDYKYNSELAEFLWKQNIREAKIISLMIENPKEINNEKINKILKGIDNIELAEQACINLLEKVEEILPQIKNWLINDNKYYKITGLILISRIVKIKKDIKDNDLLKFFDIFDNIANINNSLIINSLSKVLLQIAKKNNKLEIKVLSFIEEITNKKYKSAAWLNEEVAYFLINK